MKETLNRHYPYPEPTGDGADVSYWAQRGFEAVDVDVENLDLDVAALKGKAPYAEAAGIVSLATVPASGTLAFTITFPVGRFSVPPILLLTTASAQYIAGTGAVDKDKATSAVRNILGTTLGATTLYWRAVQMKELNASG